MGRFSPREKPLQVPPALVAEFERNPGDPAVHRAICEALAAQPERIIGFFREQRGRHRDCPDYLLAMARAYVVLDRLALAVISYQKLLREVPQSPAWQELATVYEQLEKPELADALRRAYPRRASTPDG